MDRRRKIWLMIGGGAVVVVLAALGVWWFLLRSDAPPPVSLEDAVSDVTSTTVATTTSSSPTEGTDAASTTTTVATTTAAADVDGTWVAGGNSFVGYRVNEELATVGFTTAAGRTSDVTGTLVIDGTTVTAVTIEANLLTLQSDSSRRDTAIRRQALETEAFPLASFTLTAPIELPPSATSGDPFTIDATGDFLLHGVTRTITIPLDAQLIDDTIAVVGSTDVLFSDYDIDRPTASLVLSVEDRGVMEFQLLFGRS